MIGQLWIPKYDDYLHDLVMKLLVYPCCRRTCTTYKL